MKWLTLLVLLLIVPSTLAASVSITIYGTNRSNAQTNITCNGCNNSIYVNAWNTTYVKNITINSSNASGDVISFNISNVTGYQVQELKVNKTTINAYKAGANGMLNFSYNVTGNKTLTLSPAENKGGLNFTWMQLWTWPSLFGVNFTQYFLPNNSQPIPNASTPLSAMNYSTNRSYINTTTYDVSLNGAQSITGAGFKPSSAVVFAAIAGTNAGSWGMVDVNGNAYAISLYQTTPVFDNIARVVYIGTTAGNYNLAAFTSWDADGMTITWTKTGTPTGTVTITTLFYR